MKKLLFFIFSMLFSVSLIAQQSEYVVKQEFQDKTNNLGAQVSSVKKLSNELNNGLVSVKSNLETIQSDINTLKDVSTQNAQVSTAAQAEVTALRESYLKNKQKAKALLIIELLLVAVALAFAFSIKKSMGKKLTATQKQLDETNNMLIDQGKSFDKKISALNDKIAELKVEKEEKAKKSKKE